jgi:hypothetical protein
MGEIKEQFIAVFRGGVGNSNCKYSFCVCRILVDHRSEYKFLGKIAISSLWGGGWHQGITHLEDEEYIPIDLYKGDGKYVTARLYNISLTRDEYNLDNEHDLLRMKNYQLKLKIEQLEEELATARERLRDVNLEDRRKVKEIEDSQHYKEIRSNMNYFDRIGGI